MNNRQAGAFRELVRKEERAREKWNEANLGYSQSQSQSQSSSSYNPNLSFSNTSSLPAPPQSFSNNNYNQSFSSTTPLPPSHSIPQHEIYDQAIRISSPRVVDDESNNFPQTIQRRVIRQVEVPYTRQVKVPVKTRKIVPVIVQKKIRTSKLVEVPSWTTADEEYTEIIDEPAIRQREIWVKKLVPEKYIKKSEIKKIRKVRVPTTILKNVDDFEIVEVTENKAVEVDGFRVDQVEDSKLVEVEEFQTYALHPHATGNSSVLSTREIGPVKGQKGQHFSRKIGNEIFHVYDARTRDLEMDEGGGGRPMMTNRRGQTPSLSTPSYSNNNNTNNNNNNNNSQIFDNNNNSSNNTSDDNSSTFTNSIGFRVRNTPLNGVVVYYIEKDGAGHRGGLINSDIIMYANNKPTRNLTEFRSVVNHSNGPLYVQVKRRGGQKLLLTIQR